MTQGGIPASQLQDSTRKSTIHFTERANGKKPEQSGSSQKSSLTPYEEYPGSKKVYTKDISSMTDNQYTFLASYLIRGVNTLIASRADMTISNPKIKQPLTVSLSHLGIAQNSPWGKLIIQFAKEYSNPNFAPVNSNPKVLSFCKTVLRSNFKEASIYSTLDIGKNHRSTVNETDILNAIALHRNNK